jgi:hypothetical protein
MGLNLFFYIAPSKSGKTKIITIQSKHDKSVLGTIKWKPTWRCYCFYPITNYETFWSVDCLAELVNKLYELKEEHNDGKRQKGIRGQT